MIHLSACNMVLEGGGGGRHGCGRPVMQFINDNFLSL